MIGSPNLWKYFTFTIFNIDYFKKVFDMQKVSSFTLGAFILRQLKEGRAVFITPEALKGFELNSDPTIVPSHPDANKVCPTIKFVKEYKALNTTNNVIGDIKVSEALVEPLPEELSSIEVLKKAILSGTTLIINRFSEFIKSCEDQKLLENSYFNGLSLKEQLKLIGEIKNRQKKDSEYLNGSLYDRSSKANLTMGYTRPSPFGKKKFAPPKKVIRK